MKVSVNWLREYTDIDLSIDELVAKIGAQLGAVEEVIDIGQKYKGIIVAKVVSCEKHPNADKLKVCTIDTGKEQVQVVCGASNVREGMLVAWLPPSSTVPSTLDKDPFVLEARELRGVVSNGMLASPSELAITDDHAGILELPEDIAKPGDDFAKSFGLDDYIIDIENKMFTHRPDLFGMLGIAREIAGIQQKSFTSPDWYTPNPKFPGVEAEELKLEVRNKIPELVPRFTAITMRDVQLGQSPLWLQIVLAKLGQKSINNIVDYTNYFMLLTGQPIHAYDYDKVRALSEADYAVLVIRHPKSGEKIKLLNGKNIEPRPEAMMAATDKQLIGLGGAMGGTDTEIDHKTKNIIIEAATWDMFNMRRTSMEHGIFTDAVTRFTKGQSPLQNLAVVARIVNEIRLHASGKIAGEVIDDNHASADQKSVAVSDKFINERLGIELPAVEIKKLLENVEFSVDEDKANLSVNSPFWRTDVEIPEDIVEEVGRLYGYDHLPLDLPKRSLVPVSPDKLLMLKKELRTQLAKLGANEVLTYSFVHGHLLDKVGQDKTRAYKISNALSPDLQYYRLSLTPSLLDKVHMNIKADHPEFALFELGKTHVKDQLGDDNLPREFDRLALVHTMGYYHARTYLTQLANHSLIPFNKNLLKDIVPLGQMVAPYQPERSGLVWSNKLEMPVGIVGEFRPSVIQRLKLPASCAGFEIFLSALHAGTGASYAPLSKYPAVQQDISLKTDTSLSFAQLHDALAAALRDAAPKDMRLTTECIDIFSKDQATKHTAFRITAYSYERTLTTDIMNSLLDRAATKLQTTLDTTRI